MNDEQLDRATRAAYQAYGDYVEWKNFANLPMPQFDELPQKIRSAWRVAIQAAVESANSATA